MKSKILTKLTSLTVSFALCLSALPSKSLFSDAKTYVDEVYGTKHYDYNFKSIKDILRNMTYNKDLDKILAVFDNQIANFDKQIDDYRKQLDDFDKQISVFDAQHKKNNSFISKTVFSAGSAVIAAKLVWNLYKMYRENKDASKKDDKGKKSFWTKMKEKLSVFKDEFLIYTALITLWINLPISYLNDYLYHLKLNKKREKISKQCVEMSEEREEILKRNKENSELLSNEKDKYFEDLKWLFNRTVWGAEELIYNIWEVCYKDVGLGVSIFDGLSCYYKGTNYTAEEKAKFENDLEEIRTEINKILKENGMKELNAEDYIKQVKVTAEKINKKGYI